MKLFIRAKTENWVTTNYCYPPCWLVLIEGLDTYVIHNKNKRAAVANVLVTNSGIELGAAFGQAYELAYSLLPEDIGQEIEVGDIMTMLRLLK